MPSIFLILDTLFGLAFFCHIIYIILQLRKFKESDIKEQIKKELRKKGVQRKRAILNPDTPDASNILPIIKKKRESVKKIEIEKKTRKPKMLTEYPVHDQDDDFSKDSSPVRLHKYILNTCGNDNSPNFLDSPKTTCRSNKITITLESPDTNRGKQIFPCSQFSREKLSSRNTLLKEIIQRDTDSDTSRGLLSIYSPVTERDQLMKFSSFKTIQDTVVLTKIEKENSEEKNESCEMTGHEQIQEPEANLPNLSFIEIATSRNPSEKDEESDLENNSKSESGIGDVEEFN